MPAPRSSDWLTTSEAAALLGVKPQTLYAYVSRGQLTRRQVEGGRGSVFARGDIERLAGRGARRAREGRVDVLVDTELTLIDPAGRLYYRGADAIELSQVRSYEEVASWLWTGSWPDDPRGGWAPRPGQVAAAVAAQEGLPFGVTPIHRLRLAVPAIGAADVGRHDLSEPSVLATARALVPALVGSLPPVSDGRARAASRPARRSAPSSLAGELWPRLCPRPPAAGELELLDGVLVLMADHELPASTLVARISASVLGHLYLVVGAALSTFGGSLHGGASVVVEDLLRSLPDPGTAAEVVSTRLANHEAVAGFGHVVYQDRDPRADALLERLRAVHPGSPVLATVEAVARTMANHGGPAPNIDFALGALVVTTGMVRGAGEAIAAISRCAGWIAHAMEEYRHRSRFRLRAVYTGPAPS